MSGRLRIVKMSGAGNDFIVLGGTEARALAGGIAPWARRACRRGLSVGADGVLVVEPSSPGRVRVAFYNPDGVPAFCGNGSRCAARFAALEGLAGPAVVLETAAGEIPATVSGDRVRLKLAPPSAGETVSLECGGATLTGRRVNAGVPHLVVPVDDVTAAPLEVWGPWLRRHPRFGSDGTNVDLLERRDDAIVVRTWERGVEGETLACGSGAVAAAHAARLLGWAGEAVRVLPRSGIALRVELPGPAGTPTAAYLEGDARLIFDGRMDEEGTTGFEP